MEHAATTELLRLVRGVALFVLTAIAENVGCCLPWLVLRQGRSWWLWLPALGWLALVERLSLTCWDLPGAAVALSGMAISALQPSPGCSAGNTIPR